MTKPKVAFYWCASCGGCEEAVVDLGEDLLARRRARGRRLLARRARLQARGRRGAGRRRAGGGVHQRRRPHVGAGGDGRAAAPQVRRGGRVRQLRDVGRHPRPREPVRAPRTILDAVYREAPSVANDEGTLPARGEPRRRRATLTLPAFGASVRTLDQVIDVDYYLPGCPPPVGPDPVGGDGARRGDAAGEGSGARARRGAVLASARAPPRSRTSCWCRRSGGRTRRSSTPTSACSPRAWSASAPPPVPAAPPPASAGTCPAPAAWGPTSSVVDHGAKALSAIASLLDVNDEDEIAAPHRPRSSTRSAPSTATACRLRCCTVACSRRRGERGGTMSREDPHRPHDAARGTREDPHLPRCRRRRRPRLPADPGAARLREVRPGAPRRGHAADHLAHLRRLPDGPPHGRDEGPRRPLPGRATAGRPRRSASSSTAPSWSRTTRCTSSSSAGPTSSSARTHRRPTRNILGVVDAGGARGRQGGDRRPQAAPRPDGRGGGQGDPSRLRAARRRVARPHPRDSRRRLPPRRPARSSSASSRSDAFRKIVLGNPGYVELITSEAYTHRTYYMGLVDDGEQGQLLRRHAQGRRPGRGRSSSRSRGRDYLDHIAEHVEPWTYMKFCFLKDVGWKGFTDGADSGVYSVAPLARLNAADGMATPRAQEAYEEFVTTLGGKPVHHTLANHWARIVELVYAAERMAELAADPEITDPQVRTLPTASPARGHRRRGGAAGDALPPLPDRRARARHRREPDRRHAEQRRPDRAVRRQSGAALITARPGRRRAAEPGRDGVPRLRPVLRLRHAQPARPHAADRRGQGCRRRARARDPAGLTMRTLVLGLGNEYAGDDAVGVLAVRALRA